MGRLILVSFLLFTACKNTNTPTNLETAEQIVWIEGGEVTIGNLEQSNAQPLFSQKVKGFWMQKYEVSVAQFALFVAATHYVTLAERNGGSYVFDASNKKSEDFPDAPWWKFESQVSWRTNMDSSSFLPVTHIAYEDACAYCEWKNMRLPTEIEWEYAAQKNETKGNSFNIWQGPFPYQNLKTDGFEKTAPVGSFSAGNLGIYDLQGNVWEWCQDPYHENAYQFAQQWESPSNRPIVPHYFDSFSPNDTTFVIRGGSYLCSDNFCTGYKPTVRMRSSAKSTFEHIGFRCVK